MSLSALSQLFFKLGLTAFGGPASHIAMMDAEVVEKRKWMTKEQFLDALGVTNLIPGPNSTEMAMHVGYHVGKYRGLVIAGLSFIFPAAILTGIVAWAYVTYGHTPALQPFLFGIKPAVLGIILMALWTLGKKAVPNIKLGAIFLVCALCAHFSPLHDVMIILLGGMLNIGLSYRPRLRAVSPSLFIVFFKIGSILFGSGYVLIAYLENELVHGLGWLTEAQLLDAVAMGQFTPGPVLTTATFIGYQLSGIWGAILATVGIFLPSFVFVMIVAPFMDRIRQYNTLSLFISGVNAAVMAIMGILCITLAASVLTGWALSILFIVIIGLLYTKKISTPTLVIASGILGYFL